MIKSLSAAVMCLFKNLLLRNLKFDADGNSAYDQVFKHSGLSSLSPPRLLDLLSRIISNNFRFKGRSELSPRLGIKSYG
ncbi:MAG: hypothetical protein RL632_192, partial [Bacteroidota bacterium]